MICTCWSSKKQKECGNKAVCRLTSPTGMNQGAACNGHMLNIANALSRFGSNSLWWGWDWKRI